MSSSNIRRRLASMRSQRNDVKGRRTRTPSRAVQPVRARVMDKYCAIVFALLASVVVASVDGGSSAARTRLRPVRAYVGDATTCVRLGTMGNVAAEANVGIMRTSVEMCRVDVNAVRVGTTRKTMEILEEASESEREALGVLFESGDVSIELWFDDDDEVMMESSIPVPIFRLVNHTVNASEVTIIATLEQRNGWLIFDANLAHGTVYIGHGLTHVVVSMARNTDVRFYVNGTLAGLGIMSPSLGTNATSGLSIRIGGLASERINTWWTGDVYVAAVYPKTLTDDDVSDIFNDGLASNPPQPWPVIVDVDVYQGESVELLCGASDVDIGGDVRIGTGEILIDITRLPENGLIQELESSLAILAVPHRLLAGHLSFMYTAPLHAWSKKTVLDHAEPFDVIEFMPVDINGTRSIYAGIINVHVIAKVIDLTSSDVALMEQNVLFGVFGRMAFDNIQLDDWCDANEEACALSVDGEFILRRAPIYGEVYECLSGLKRQVGDIIYASDLCYNATRSAGWQLTNVYGEALVKYNDSFEFDVADDWQSSRFRLSLVVHQGILVCDSHLSMIEDEATSVTLQAMDTNLPLGDIEFIIEQSPNFIGLFLEDGRKVSIGQAVMGQTCGIRPACAPYSIIQHTNRACLHVIVVPFADYYNTYSAYVGPEYPPWQMVLSRVAFRAKNGERLSKQATLTIEVTNKVDAVELSVNRTMYEAYYLERAVLGTFRLYASDFDAYKLRVDISSARSNLLAVSNVSALKLCDNPFLTGDGTGNAKLVFYAVPSVIQSILNSLIYIHLGQTFTQDEIHIRVGNMQVKLIALLHPSLRA